MHIDNYDMGRIEIDGQGYERDVIVAGGRVQANWWRQEGHVLKVEDLATVVETGPSCLIVGTGKYGRLTIPPQTEEFLSEKGIELEAYDTGRACERFNELTAAGQEAAGAFHLTC